MMRVMKLEEVQRIPLGTRVMVNPFGARDQGHLGTVYKVDEKFGNEYRIVLYDKNVKFGHNCDGQIPKGRKGYYLNGLQGIKIIGPEVDVEELWV